MRDGCRWGGVLCREPAGYGRFGSFCETHAAKLAALTPKRGPKKGAGGRVVRKPPKPVEPTCALLDCGTRAWKSDEPLRCYLHRNVPAEARYAPRVELCVMEGCTRAAKTRGYCREHVSQSPEAISLAERVLQRQEKLAARVPCAVDGCDVWASAKSATGRTCWLNHRAVKLDELSG